MNALRLPDPINARHKPFEDKTRPTQGKLATRPASQTLSNSSPRYASNYDINQEPISTLRLNNNVPQTRGMGGNVYLIRDKALADEAFQKTGTGPGRQVGLSNRNGGFNPERRGINYEPQPYLNNTIGSDYTEHVSSVDSFDYKYYKTNDPDQISEMKYFKPTKSVTHPVASPMYGPDKAKLDYYLSMSKNRNTAQTHEELLRNDIILKERIAAELLKAKLRNEMMSRSPKEILAQAKPDYDARATNIASLTNPIYVEDRSGKSIGEYCQLSKDEVFKGLGSIGLALSKVFSLTGKGVLYLCSSITDTTEGLFETDNKNVSTKCNKNNKEDKTHAHCNCNSTNKDCSNLPDLHINYESDCYCEDLKHDHADTLTNHVYINGRKAELTDRALDDRYMAASRPDFGLRKLTNENRDRNRGDEYTPKPYANYHENRYDPRQNYNRGMGNHVMAEKHNVHMKNYDTVNGARKHNVNLKIDYDGEIERYEGDASNKTFDPYNTYNNRQPNKNVYRERELNRGVANVERYDNRAGGDYSFEDKANRDRPQYDIKNTEPPSFATNTGVYDTKRVNTNKVETNILSVMNSRAVEPRSEHLNGNRADNSKTIDSTRGRKNMIEVPIFNKPNLIGYGNNPDEETNKEEAKPNVIPRRDHTVNTNQVLGNVTISQSNEAKPSNMSDHSSKSSNSESIKQQLDANVEKQGRNEPRKHMDLRSDLSKESQLGNSNEALERVSIPGMDSITQKDRISTGNSTVNGSLDRISIGETSSAQSVDRISTGESDSSNSDFKKKQRRRIFPFYKGSKEKN